MNLYEDIPDRFGEEIVLILQRSPGCRVERILSCGQTTPEDTWDDQDETEWIALLQGEAVLLLEAANGSSENGTGCENIHLNKGDTLLIRPHRRHRVIYTSMDPPAIWLCVFMKG